MKTAEFKCTCYLSYQIGNLEAYMYTVQSIITHFRLSANDADKQFLTIN